MFGGIPIVLEMQERFEDSLSMNATIHLKP